MGADCAAFAGNGQGKTLPVPAHPADLPSGHTGHKCEWMNITVHGRSGCDKSVLPDRNTANDGGVRPKRGAALYECVSILILTRYRSSGIIDVCKHHAGTAKYAIFEGDIIKDRNVVLDLYVVSNNNFISNKYPLPEGYIATESRACAHVHKMPNSRTLTDTGAVVYNG